MDKNCQKDRWKFRVKEVCDSIVLSVTKLGVEAVSMPDGLSEQEKDELEGYMLVHLVRLEKRIEEALDGIGKS